MSRGSRIADPPRRVPAAVHVNLLFGHWLSQVGWLAFGVGMILVWVFTMNSDLVDWIEFRGELAVTQGSVLSVEELGDTDRDKLYRIGFSYEVDGRGYEGTSFGVVRPEGPGAQVEVEYLAAQPEVSRIEGMRRRRWFSQFFPIIVALVGLGLGLGRVPRARRDVRILRSGVMVMGRFVSKRPSGSVAGKELYDVELSYEPPPRTGREVVHYRDPAEVMPKERRLRYETGAEGMPSQDHREPVLVDPVRPKRAIAVAGLPGLVDFDRDGLPYCHGSAVLPLVLPTLGVLAHGIVAILWAGC